MFHFVAHPQFGLIFPRANYFTDFGNAVLRYMMFMQRNHSHHIMEEQSTSSNSPALSREVFFCKKEHISITIFTPIPPHSLWFQQVVSSKSLTPDVLPSHMALSFLKLKPLTHLKMLLRQLIITQTSCQPQERKVRKSMRVCTHTYIYIP